MTLTADDFRNENLGVQITVRTSGTGGGFKTFCAGETDISNASRPINDTEAAACRAAGISYRQLLIANDAVSVAINPANDWATCLTVEQLKKMWAPDAQGVVTNWNQIDATFPDEALSLYGPGTESGTFDYFTAEINGVEDASRTDYTASEDDFLTRSGLEAFKGAIGYFGFSYLESNSGVGKAVAIDSGNGCVAPSAEAVFGGTYAPLSRPLFVYVSDTAAVRPEVKAFVEYYVDNQDRLTYDAFFVGLSDEQKSGEQAANLSGILG